MMSAEAIDRDSFFSDYWRGRGFFGSRCGVKTTRENERMSRGVPVGTASQMVAGENNG